MKRHENDIVRRAAQEWRRATAPPQLSAGARDRVLRRTIQENTAVRPFPALFVTTRRVILAGVVPALLLGVLVLVARVPGPAVEAVPTVVASRVGDGVVFTIDNGKKNHVVYRSTVPHRFDPHAGVQVKNGQFADSGDDGARVVFYRID